MQRQIEFLKTLSKEIPPNMAVIVGAIVPNPKAGKPYWNAAVVLQRGKKPLVFPKQLLPTYDVFNESRHIQPGDVSKNHFKFKGQKILITICEDIWAWPRNRTPRYSSYEENPIKKLKPGSFDLVINLSASPFTHSKFDDRRRVTLETVKHLRCPLIYVNMVGAQDELIFDGGSFALDEKKKIIAQCVRFKEDFNVLDLGTKDASLLEVASSPQDSTRQALVLGIKDFVNKTGFSKVHLGLSGGIDSAVVACLAVDALGPMNVTGLGLKGPFTSPDSVKWAKELASKLAIHFHQVDIDPIYTTALQAFEAEFGQQSFDVLNENLQARLRGILLMAYANRNPSLLLGTSNKSELAVGYSTLYGDLCGGLLPIGDLLKTEVYELAALYNAESELIPKGIIERPPSAELRQDQKDQDSLPPYDFLDSTVSHLIDETRKPKSEEEEKILRMIFKSEFKRWQAPPILKVSNHAFGQGRKLPLAAKFSD